MKTALATDTASTTLVGPVFGVGRDTIHARVAAAARRHPEQLALACGDTRLTHAELGRRTNQLAHVLRRYGATRGRCVALCLPRSAEMIVALLGILKTGAAYVPLLPESPHKRLAHQVRETASVAVVTLSSIEPLLAELGPRTICFDRDERELAAAPTGDLDETASLEDDCYVIYTSGSTGLPKGVAVSHRNLANYTTSILRMLAPASPWSYATVSTIAADLGHTCIFPALLSGGTLHVIDDVLDGEAMAAYCKRVALDVLKITPSHLEALLASPSGGDILPARALFTGGEALRWPLVQRVRRLAPKLRWFNHYGPTETTVGSCTHPVPESVPDEPTTGSVPIGRPIGNTRCYVLDPEGKPVPSGGDGELFIAGAGVARGYLKRPDLTAERFVNEPGAANRRAYRTGDRVRLLCDHSIEFIGRVDFQVKIRGFRIELGEIETNLLAHPAVREAVVIARDVGHAAMSADPVLCAYVVLHDDRTATSPALREALASALPAHMIPAHISVLEALPLNPNGKVDRKALPPPPVDDSGRQQANDDLERQLCELWSELLGHRVGVHDNFFQSGGTSLAALHLIARIERQIGVRVPHAVLIAAPTVARMADVIRRGEGRRHLCCLVPMQPQGQKPPFFCVHGGGGHVYFYRDLARRLGEDQPLYALQARVNDGLPPHDTVEEMAEEYVAEIRALFPHGPYYLGGVSFGGKVALEMAQRLRAAGEEVALLVMFDTWGPGYPAPRSSVTGAHQAAYWLYRRIEHHAGSLWLMEREQVMPYLRQKGRHALVETAEALRELSKSALRRVRVRMGQSELADLRKGESYIRKASLAYRPRPYPGRIVLFRCTAQPLGIHYDRNMGWGPIARGGIELYESPGLHAAMVAEPRVRFLVDKLRPVLERAQGTASGLL